MTKMRRRVFAAGSAAFAFSPYIARAQKKYDTGVTDKEIKLGHTNPYSGPLSAYGTIGKAIEAYWKMVNDKGGINGRKINFITYDDGFSPPKTVEMVRKLVEDDKVYAIFQLLGTPTNTVVQKYLNQKKVPQLFVATGASKWGMPKEFPWTMGWQPDYHTEAAIYAKHVLSKHKDNLKDLRIGMLYQNDDSGKDYTGGFLAGLGKENEKYVTAKVSYEVTDPTVDSYSGFWDNGRRKATGLGDWLRARGVTEVVVLGLATDYCVRATALDAVADGFACTLVADGCRAVELAPGDGERAIEAMREGGVTITTSDALIAG